MKEKSFNRPFVLDTSSLLAIEENKMDIFRELIFNFGDRYFLIPTAVINEIKNLAKNKGKRGVKAKIALSLIEANKERVVFISSFGKVDNVVLEVAKSNKGIVVTKDKALKNRALKSGLAVVVISRKKLILL